MCLGGRLIADFVAGTDARPGLPGELQEHLTTTVNGLWVVWAHKLARPAGGLFFPVTGGSGYPADARAKCRRRGIQGAHKAPDPGCTCGFHALSSPRLPGLPGLFADPGFTALTVALSGRVLAFEWPSEGVLWRAERQTVVRIGRGPLPDRAQGVRIGRRPLPDRAQGAPGKRHHPGDPDGRPAVVPAAAPRDSGPVRLKLPVVSPAVRVCHDDAGWCVESGTLERSPAPLVLALQGRSHSAR